MSQLEEIERIRSMISELKDILGPSEKQGSTDYQDVRTDVQLLGNSVEY